MSSKNYQEHSPMYLQNLQLHQYLQERALPRSVTGAKDPTAPTQSEGGIDRYQLSNAPEVAVTLERHSLSPYRLTLTDGL